MTEFLGKLSQAIERHHRGQKDPEEPWNEHDYERFMKECDARTDKYGELLESTAIPMKPRQRSQRKWDGTEN